MSVIPALGSLKQENHEFKAGLDCMVEILSQKRKKKSLKCWHTKKKMLAQWVTILQTQKIHWAFRVMWHENQRCDFWKVLLFTITLACCRLSLSLVKNKGKKVNISHSARVQPSYLIILRELERHCYGSDLKCPPPILRSLEGEWTRGATGLTGGSIPWWVQCWPCC